AKLRLPPRLLPSPPRPRRNRANASPVRIHLQEKGRAPSPSFFLHSLFFGLASLGMINLGVLYFLRQPELSSRALVLLSARWLASAVPVSSALPGRWDGCASP